MSGGMRQLASTTQSAFNRVDQSIARTTSRLRRPVQSIDILNRKLDDLRKTRDLSVNYSQIRAANREIDKTERKLQRLETMGKRSSGGGSASGGGLLGLLSSTRGMVAAAGITGALALGGSAIGSGMQAGAQRTSFEVMGGKQQGGQLFTDLTKFAQDSIFGKEVMQNAQTMLAFGASVKEVMPDLKMLGDISMGNKDRLGSLTLAFSQVRAAGKLTGQDLLQFVNAGFNPLQIIAEKTGRSMAQLRDDVSEGAISFDMVKKAFQVATSEGGKFYNMTNKIADTPFGKWEAIKGQVEGLGVQLGTAMLPLASKVIDVLSGLADQAPAIIDALAPVFSGVGDMIQPIMSLLPPFMAMIRPVLDAVAAFPIKQLVTDLVAFGQTLFTGVAPILENLKPLIVTVMQVVGTLTSKILQLAKPIIELLSPALAAAAKLLSAVLVPALKLTGWVIGGIIDAIKWMVDKLSWLIKPISALVNLIGDGVNMLMDNITGDAATKQAYEGAKKVGTAWQSGFNDGMTGAQQNWSAMAQATDWRSVGAMGRGASVAGKPKTPSTSIGSTDFAGIGAGTSDKITGGGQKTITINVSKFFDNIIINGSTQGEIMDNFEQRVEEVFLRVLQSANAAN